MEDKELGQLLDIAKENNKILHSMQKSARIGTLFRVVYWIFVIASFLGAYYYVQPYIDQLLSIYNQASSAIGGLSGQIIP